MKRVICLKLILSVIAVGITLQEAYADPYSDCISVRAAVDCQHLQGQSQTPPTNPTPAPTSNPAPANNAPSAAAQREDEIQAIIDFVMPTTTNSFSLSLLNSDSEAALYISNDNGDYNVVFRIIRLIATIVGTLAILLYIVAGYFLIFSAGEENQITKGKQIVTFTTLGLILTFTAFIIVQFVMGMMYFAA